MTLRRRWTVAFVAGELMGFVPPAITGAVLAALDASDPVLVAGLVAAGAIEGAVLGATTGRVLTAALPDVPARRWIQATATGAALAWLAGMGGAALVGALGPRALVVAVPGYVAGLLAMPVLQTRALRPVVRDARRWIPVSAGAWLIGVMIPITALSTVPNAWPVAVHVVVGVVAAVAMGAVVGTITGRTLERFAASTRLEVSARATP